MIYEVEQLVEQQQLELEIVIVVMLSDVPA